MEEEQDVSIDDIRLWNVRQLKAFLKERKIKVSGRKDELVALVYSAKRNPTLAPIAPVTPGVDKDRRFADLLVTPEGSVPDPSSLTNWEMETKAIEKWPPTMAFDIGKYLNNIDNIPLKERLISDYKDSKGYSYFASGWVRPIDFHEIDSSSAYCFLRTECMPSQRINNIPWRVWVCIHKKSGHVNSAFCTCFAGYGGSCNHVAAILFKLVFAWRNGLTNPACTDKECGWSSFGAKRSIEPRRVCEMTLSKPLFSKRSTRHTDIAGINPQVRRLFSPTEARSSGTCSGPSLTKLVNALYPAFSTACCFQYVSMDLKEASSSSAEWDFNVGHHEEVVTSQTSALPIPLWTLASQASSVEEFLDTLPTYDAPTIERLELATRGQASNTAWFDQRKGRITGSVVHSVLTRGRRLLSSQGKQMDNSVLVKRLLGYKQLNENITALKYGREMEGEAREQYVKVQRESGHTGLSVEECGLYVHPDIVYVGASPDGLVKCSCGRCGSGVLEVMCPLSASHTHPDKIVLAFLKREDNISLSASHPYYSQVQLQMGLTNTQWCDFFVYSRHGHTLIRVPFDAGRWNELLKTCEHMFRTEVAKELVTKKLFLEM